jgi:hypothetical protein
MLLDGSQERRNYGQPATDLLFVFKVPIIVLIIPAGLRELQGWRNWQPRQIADLVWRDPLRVRTPLQSDSEEDIIKGVVAVTKYKGKAFTVNLPEIIRRLKRRWNK